MNNPLIEKFLTLSTSHIKPETADWIEQQCLATKNIKEIQTLIVYNKEDYGWFVYVGNIKDMDIEDIKKIPSDLLFLAGYANGVDCPFIQFDIDVSVCEFPIYQ